MKQPKVENMHPSSCAVCVWMKDYICEAASYGSEHSSLLSSAIVVSCRPFLTCSALLRRPYTHRLFIDSGGKWQRLSRSGPWSRSLSWKIKPKDIQVFTCLSVFRCCQGRVVHFASPGLFKVSFFLLAPLLLWSLSAEILCPVKLIFIHLNTNGHIVCASICMLYADCRPQSVDLLRL